MRRYCYYTLPKAIILIIFTLTETTTNVYGQTPVANFSASTVTGCSPLFVQFTDQSTGSPFSWNWDLGNGQLSTVRNPVGSYNQPGTYTVRLIVRNSAGIDEEIKTNYITVSPSPQAAFSANLTTSCAPATIQFTDQSTTPPGAGTITSWLWNFGDGNTSTQQNPSHIFTATGFYTISLRITSTSGCQSFVSIGRYIRVVSGIKADFGFTQPGTCQGPFLINFQDLSSGPGTLSYLWNFGNGGPTSNLQNPSSTYAATGTYPVQLNVQSSLGCSGTITKNISITGKTTDFIAPTSICIGQTVTFQNNSSPPPVSSFWNFGDGTTSSQINPTKTFFNGGVYSIKLINNYGNCSDSITKTINVISQPVIDFTANDSTACAPPFAVQFTDKSPAATTWIWDFGDGVISTQRNPTHTYTSSGNFNVTLTITLPGGCSNTITKSQFIKIQSTTVNIANVPAGGCTPFTFSPLHEIQSVDSIVSYVWNMGEPGAIYNTEFPTHTYNAVGNYSVTLTTTSQSGCVRTVTVPNAVRTGSRPTVNFSFVPNNACASTAVQFTDLSVTTPGAFVQWQWDFGDSSISSVQQHPQHIYLDTGTLNVSLIVTNNGCADTAFMPIQVLPPVAKFGYTLDCNNRTQVTFLDSSLVSPIYGAITYEWRMGDPANTIFSGSTPPVFTYPAIGTYTATLIVTNGPCSYQTTRQIIIADEQADFIISKNPVCKSEVFTLSATTSNITHIEDYTWSIGPATISDTSRSIQYSLPTYGTYDVTLTLEDINGCLNTKTITNYITVSGPIANFTPNGPGGCVNSNISFTDNSTPAGSITQWTFNYGDGNQQTYTSPPFNHTYAQPGSYTVSLMIKSTVACADTIALPNAIVITQPVAAFKADTIYCPSSPLQFVDTSSGSGLTHTWYFGDGATSTLQNPTHSYSPGNYNVKLVISDMVGCRDSVTKNQYIKIGGPRPAFSMIDSVGVCIPLITSFNFMGTDYQSFYWDFGDGGTSLAQNPSHFYNSYGTFTPKLYLIGAGGCIDSAQATVEVYDPNIDMQVAASPLTACNSITTNFNLTILPGFKFKFYFGDGTIDSSQQTTLTHTYNSPGSFTPYIIVSDKFGCEAVRYGEPIYVYGAIPLFGTNKKEFCDQGEVFFMNFTLNNDPIISTVWDFGDGNTSTTKDPSHVFPDAGTYIVRLTVTTQNQCTSSFTDTIRVYPTPQLSITGKDTVCINSTEIFNGVLVQPDSTITWQWNLGNGSFNQLQNPSVQYSGTGNYTISLTAANKLGCSDTTTHLINVLGLPTAVAAANPLTIISGGSTSLNMNYSGSVINYNWLPPQNLDCTNCMNPVANPQFTTRYVVQIEDRFGCKNSGEVTVRVTCAGQNFFIPNTFTPNGDGSNDVFYLRGTGLFRVKAMRVFNRWGELVFEKREFPVNNAAYGWDGTYKGKKGQPDVYVYQLEIICNNGELIKYAGNIALVQ